MGRRTTRSHPKRKTIGHPKISQSDERIEGDTEISNFEECFNFLDILGATWRRNWTRSRTVKERTRSSSRWSNAFWKGSGNRPQNFTGACGKGSGASPRGRGGKEESHGKEACSMKTNLYKIYLHHLDKKFTLERVERSEGERKFWESWIRTRMPPKVGLWVAAKGIEIGSKV